MVEIWAHTPSYGLLGDEYFQAILSTLERQLGRAGIRLARFLNFKRRLFLQHLFGQLAVRRLWGSAGPSSSLFTAEDTKGNCVPLVTAAARKLAKIAGSEHDDHRRPNFGRQVLHALELVILIEVAKIPKNKEML
jgi:hypothetical protein